MIERAPEIIGALEALVAFLDKMGVPGLLALVFLGPIMIVVALFALDYMRQRHARQEGEDRRKEAEEQRQQVRDLVEQHRSDMNTVLRDLTAKHAEVSQYYKDNVELVKTTQRLATDMRDIITNNTRAVEHLAGAIRGNFFCPVARENATGNK